MTVVAGVDSSTQSCTVALYESASGTLLGTGTARHPSTSPPVSEQNGDDWWRAFQLSLGRACENAGISSHDIRGISVAAQYHGLVALDERDELIRPVKLWNDTTSNAQAAELIRQKPQGWWAREVGSTLTAAFTITKIAWLAENEPANLQKTRTVLMPHDWLTYRLTGRKVTDRVDASGTGYFDAARETWRYDILAEIDDTIDWQELLPAVLGPDEPAGHAITQSAHELGLRPDTVVACGTGDQAAAALALGLDVTDAAISLGTSGTVITSSTRAVYDPAGEINVTANAQGGFQPIAVLLNAAKVTDTFARILGVDHLELSNLALAAQSGSVGLPTLVAYLDGERTPDRPTARGLMAGISTSTTREDMARSAFEGVAFGLRAGLDAIRRIGLTIDGPLLLTGGAAVSEAYRTVLADVFESEVSVVEGNAGLDVARGAAIQAAAALGASTVTAVKAAWRRPSRIVASPDPQTADRTRHAYRRYLTVRDNRDFDGLFA